MLILCIYYVYIMYILCIYYVYTMYILCIYYVYIMYILCWYYVYIMYVLCIYYVYIMYILCIYYVCIMYILCIYYVYTMHIHNDHQHTMNRPLRTEAGFEPDDLDRKVGLFSPLEPGQVMVWATGWIFPRFYDMKTMVNDMKTMVNDMKTIWLWKLDVWLVVWNMTFMTFQIFIFSSSQLTNSYFSLHFFQRGGSTTNQ